MKYDERSQTLLIFRLSGIDCAFPLEVVREIVPMTQLSCPPGLPSGLAGFLNLRGEAVPIARLDRLFDLPEQRADLHTPLIVLRGVILPIGFLVEYVRRIVAVPCAQFLNIPEDRTFRGCAIASVQLDGELIQVLSPVAFLDASESRLLADYCSMSKARQLHMEETT